MIITELRVFREVDNRAKDGRLIDALQTEIAVLRRECKRLQGVVQEQEARWAERER